MAPNTITVFVVVSLLSLSLAASLSEARSGLAGTSVNGLALFAGGDGSAYSTRVDIYNASSGVWTTAALSQPREALAATSTGGLALFAGGGSASESSVVDIYNASTNSWSTAALSQPRTSLAATSVGSLALFAGGHYLFGDPQVVDIYNASSGVWTTAALSLGRSSLAATTVGNLAIFAGGMSSSTSRAVVDIYNAQTNSWTTAALSQARHNLAATSVGNLALFAGGNVNSPTVTSAVVDIYNASSGVWTTAALSRARSGLAATSIGDLAFFAGGYRDPAYLNTVDIYNATADSWTATTLSQARSTLAAASVDGLALFAGGYSGGDYYSQQRGTIAVVNINAVAFMVALVYCFIVAFTDSFAITAFAVICTVTVVVAQFNPTAPAVAISTQTEAETTQQVDLNLVSLEEVSSLDATIVLQSIDLEAVGWTDESSTSGKTTEHVFTSHLGASTAGANNATLKYLFSTFDSDELITTESNYSFAVTPALLKFSLNVTSWRWNSTSGKLRLTIRIDPPFVRFTRWEDTPQVGMTTFLFTSARTDQASAVVRLLDFGETGQELSSRIAVEAFAAASSSSSLSLTFDHFNDTLLFDPDFGLLLGEKADGGGSDDNLGLIIGVSVAIPLAIAFVVLFVAVVLLVGVLRRRADRARSRGAVALGVDHDDEL